MAARQILIDGHNLGLQKGTGVATYARNLSREASALGHEVSVLYGQGFGVSKDPLLREIAFFDTPKRAASRTVEVVRQIPHALLGPLGNSAMPVPLTGSVVARAFQSQLPECKTIYNATDVFRRSHAAFSVWNRFSPVHLPQPIDLAHWTYPLPVRVNRCPNIYTLHDLVPLRLPYTTLDNKRNYLRLVRMIARQADHIVTVSECSRRDIIDLLGVSEDRVTNTFQSVHIARGLQDKPEADVSREIEGAAGVGYKEYFLFWGSIEPKKNIGRMIEAYRASGVQTPLVIVGAQAWRSEEELRLLKNESLNPSKRITLMPYAPYSLLVSLIRGAKVALFPSLYEGFGLPALEAMLLGTPVICSNTASLPEVVGDAAVMVDPYDTAALAAAIRTLDADSDLRDAYSGRGIGRAGHFTPESYRTRLKLVYDRFI